jgi:hypothetical protein
MASSVMIPTLTHGYWEAKDTQDDLEAEIRKKRAAGYAVRHHL